jgi:hypothetical protein
MQDNYLDQSPSLLSIGSTGVSSQGNLCDGSGVQISHDATFFEVLNFLGISNIFVKVFVIVENCLYIF